MNNISISAKVTIFVHSFRWVQLIRCFLGTMFAMTACCFYSELAMKNDKLIIKKKKRILKVLFSLLFHLKINLCADTEIQKKTEKTLFPVKKFQPHIEDWNIDRLKILGKIIFNKITLQSMVEYRKYNIGADKLRLPVN